MKYRLIIRPEVEADTVVVVAFFHDARDSKHGQDCI